MNKQTKIAIAVILGIYILFSATLDLAVANFFFDGKSFSDHPLYLFIRDTAATTKNFYLILSITLFVLSLLVSKWKRYRVGMLVLIVAPMFSYYAVHKPIKTMWQRPRPTSIIDFGGQYQFQPFYSYHGKGGHDSFPSSHCAKDFMYIALCFVGIVYRHTLMLYAGILLTFVFGFSQMIASVAVGRHFLSDTIYPPLQIILFCYLFWKLFTYIEEKIKDYYGKNSATMA